MWVEFPRVGKLGLGKIKDISKIVEVEHEKGHQYYALFSAPEKFRKKSLVLTNEGMGDKSNLTVSVVINSKLDDKDKFANPLPHVLMLTAIVVGVSTLGLALAISQKVHGSFGTLEEDEILDQLKPGGHD